MFSEVKHNGLMSKTDLHVTSNSETWDLLLMGREFPKVQYCSFFSSKFLIYSEKNKIDCS
jgi:hypothetical protein